MKELITRLEESRSIRFGSPTQARNAARYLEGEGVSDVRQIGATVAFDSAGLETAGGYLDISSLLIDGGWRQGVGGIWRK